MYFFFARLRPVVIPHHKGRKRMHLELRDTVTKLMTTDFKQKIIDSVSATLSTVYNIATGNQQQQQDDPDVRRALEDSMTKQADEDEAADAANPRTIAASLNSGHRVDHVLQEAPLESFNEYLFAMASHLCYWESEDTALMVLKDIYAQLGIYPDDQQQQLQQQQKPYVVPPPPATALTTAGFTPTIAPPPTTVGEPMRGPATLQTTSTIPTIAPPPTAIGEPMKGPATLQAFSPTPTIAPPPTAVGEPMKGPAILQATTTVSATPTIAPPPTAVGEVMKGPATLQTATPPPAAVTLPATALGPTSSAYASSTPMHPAAPSKSPPPPAMFSPSNAGGPSPIDAPPMQPQQLQQPSQRPLGPPSVSSPLFAPPVMRPPGGGTSPYAKSPRVSPAAAAAAPTVMGMDPTAPQMATDKPLGPPPMGGFYRKN